MSERIVMVGDKKFRLPFIDLIPFDEDQNQKLGENIKQSLEIQVPVVCWKEKSKSNDETVIDGAHRVLWASKHSVPKVPIKYVKCETHNDAKSECLRLNTERRHLGPRQLHEFREHRLQVIAEMAADGVSQREMAKVTGVSQTQVARDLDKASLNRTVQTPVCKRCKRLGSRVKDCKQCSETGKKKERKKAAAAPSQDGMSDDFGNPLPKNRKTAFKDPWIQSAIDTLAKVSHEFRMSGLANGIEKRKAIYPFFDPKEFVDGYGFVVHYLDQLLAHLKDNRPSGVCPKCSGTGCADCRSSGLVPRKVYGDLKK